MTIDEAINKLKAAEGKAKESGTLALKTEVNKTIKLNFIQQGRPVKWAAKKHPDGRAILTGRTGNGQRSINVQEDLSRGEVDVGSNLIYMQAHNTGATIYHPARSFAFRTKRDGKKVFARKDYSKPAKTTQGKAYTVTLPRRAWAVWTQTDTQRAAPNIINAVSLAINNQF